MADCDLSAWNGLCSLQLNIVLLGGRNSGKNSVGNLLLGREEFVTKERTSSSRRLGAAAGRRLAVVDTPGWWCDFGARDTSELVKREIVSGVSLCSPGPHAFLIVVKASSAFSERRRRAVEEHVALLGEEAWNHCVVVFASDDKRRHDQVERCMERGGEALRWLADKCGQRCHGVNLNDGTESKELLRTIDKLVTENGNRAYEMQEQLLRATAEEERQVEHRAQLRLNRVKRHRSLMRERLRPVTDIRIVLLGAKGSGKTSVLNTFLGRGSSSSEPPRRTARCQVVKGRRFGRELTVVDTPGWWMNYFPAESPVFDRRELVLSLSLCPPGPHVFLLVVRADRAFTETYRRAAQEHLELIGERIWARVLLLFSFGDWLGGATAERYIESEGAALGWLAEKCGDRYHVLDGKTQGDGFQVRELIGKLEEMMTGSDCSWHYEIERNVLEQLEWSMRRETERAEERLADKKKQRQMAKTLMEKLNPSPELRLVLIGGRKSGKSSCGNTILGKEAFDTDGRKTACTEERGSVGGKTVTVLDAPGRFSVTPDLPTPSCALLLVVNASTSFTHAHGAAIEERLDAAGGQRAWSRAAVLFSHGDWLGDTGIEHRIESEGGPLRGLVDRCGNRYHVMDNTRPEDRAQVDELLELLEEMLAGDRMDALHRGDHMWNSPSAAGEKPPDGGTSHGKDLKELLCDSPECPASTPDLSPSASSQMVALRGRGGAGLTTVGGLLSRIAAAALSGGREATGPTFSLPLQLHFPLGRLRPSGENGLVPAGRRPMLVVSSQQQQCSVLREEEEVVSVHTLCHPALRERTLTKLWERGGLQALIDQWGDSSLEELEAFIDSYFEMVWEQTMGSLQSTETDSFMTKQEEEEEEEEEEVLSSIDRKLTKLELLEEIKSDLGELRQSLERSWKAIEDLRHKSKHSPDNAQ